MKLTGIAEELQCKTQTPQHETCVLTAWCWTTEPVRQYNASAANSEEAVGYKHGALLAKVPILCDVLRAHHQNA